MKTGNQNKVRVSLRKFPYPYKCALAISSDIDATDSLDKFLMIQKFMNTMEDTPLGKGLGLETGNSFWFLRNSYTKAISYFDSLTDKPTAAAPVIRELIQSGHIDVLHTYGDFNNGGFLRHHAEMCAEEMHKQGLRISTWVNHGDRNNAQNIGRLDYFHGDDRYSPMYHMDITKALGFKYFWLSQVTHLVGQDSKFNIRNPLKNNIQRLLAIKYGDRQIPPFFNNRLMNEVTLRDGTRIKAFMRFINPWGRHSFCDINNLVYQVNDNILQELISDEGFMILYTHLGSNGQTDEVMPKKTREVLENLARREREGKVFVTTTTRLLRYYDAVSNIDYKETEENGMVEIRINEPEGFCLDGLTFYCSDPEKVRVISGGSEIPTIINPEDHTNKRSISIQFPRLQYPF